jgi:hypothetical protein
VVLADLTSAFPSQVRLRGATYFRHGVVDLVEVTPLRVAATLQGTRLYTTSLAFRDGKLALSCTCDDFQSDGPCKHLWATILAIDERHGLVEMTPFHGITLSPPSHADAAPARAKPASSPRWKELLQRERTRWHEERAVAPRWTGRLLYSVDVERSREGNLVVMLLEQGNKRKGGGPAKPKPVRIPLAAVGHLEDPTDRQMLPLLLGASAIADTWGALAAHDGGHDATLRTIIHVPATMAEAVMPALSASGRLFLRELREGPLVPARYDGAPWEFVLSLRRIGDGPTTEIAGSFRRGSETMELAAPMLLSEEGWLLRPGIIGRFDHFGAMGIIKALLAEGKVIIPASEERPFLAALLEQASLPRLDLPEGLSFREIVATPRPALRIEGPVQPQARWGPADGRLGARLSFLYQGVEIPTTDERLVVALVGEGLLIRRDRAAELEALQRLEQLGFRAAHVSYFAPENKGLFELPPKKLSAAVRALTQDGWHVEAKGKAYRTASRFTFSVASGIDWFDLTAKADFGGVSVSLPRLLQAVRKGETTIVLDDGSVGMLPEAWLAKHALLGAMGAVNGDAVRFERRQAGLLDALLLAEPDAEVDEVFRKARQELGQFAGVEPQAAPSGFHGELRPYQEAGLGWLGFLRRFGFGGCLADDMGLGKTVQVLAHLEVLRAASAKTKTRRPSLVVVPKSLVWNWSQEAARFTPRLKVLAHVGGERGGDVTALTEADLVVTTYGTLRADLALLREIEFDTVILDEAQAIKNAGSESAKAARLLRGQHRLALSGTPIENHIGELWSLFEFLNPSLLGAARAFEGVTRRGRPAPETVELLSRALRPFILRRTKEVVAPELPPKHEETILCELDQPQRRLYDELRDHYRAGLLGKLDLEGDAALRKSKILVLEALLRLRQASCHPGLIDKRRAGEASAKLDVLLPRLEEVRAEGHKALVFSQFTSFLSILRSRLDAEDVPYQYLDGDVQDRAARVARFQEDPAQSLFLISLKAGGVGLNLTAADYVFILDPWWNPAVEAQAVDRAHRIGQTKRVFVYRLLCRDTVEEKVAALQETKKGLADSIIGGSQSLVRDLDRETLELLLS